MVEAILGKDVDDAATEVLKGISDDKVERWNENTSAYHVKWATVTWANESLTIATNATTKYCVQQGGSCDTPSGSVTIDKVYVEAADPVIRERLLMAGVRLASLLDAAFGD